MSDDLLDRWSALLEPLAAIEAGRALLQRWAEPHRHYHVVAHLRAVLDRVDELASATEDVDSVRLAGYFHDAVYDPTRVDNEERSAKLALAVLADVGLDPARAREVARLVLVTAEHRADPADREAAVLCDGDLAVLAAGPEEYAAYASGVREEYRHLSEASFKAGRANVLRGLLGRPQIFTTWQGQDWWEERAQHNIAAELTLLEGAELLAPGAHAGASSISPHDRAR